jgi:hypothetical protein
MLKFSNTEAFWTSVAKAPLAFGAARKVEVIDGPYPFAGLTKWFGRTDLTNIVFCVAFSGQRQHARRIVTAIKGHLKSLATTHDEFAVTVRDEHWELSDGNTRALLYKALLLKKMGMLQGELPVTYGFDDLPKTVRVAFTQTASAEQSLAVYSQYNSREAVKTTRDAVHTALKLSAAECGIELQSEFFRSEGAIATASEYAFFPGRARPDLAVKVLQPVLPTLDAMGLTRRPGLATTLPGGAVAALAVLAGIDSVKALDFAQAVFSAVVQPLDEEVTLPNLFVRRVQLLREANQFSSAGGLRRSVAELVGIVLAYVGQEDGEFKVPVRFCEPCTVGELVALAATRHPALAGVFRHRDALVAAAKGEPLAASEPCDTAGTEEPADAASAPLIATEALAA